MNDSLLMVTEIMGKRVKTKGGHEVGVIQNIMINPRNSMIVYIVLCYADFIGKTHRHFIIPNDMAELKRDNENVLYFEVERQELLNVYRLNTHEEKPVDQMNHQIFEIDQDESQFSYHSLF